jgi:hypothetical protein
VISLLLVHCWHLGPRLRCSLPSKLLHPCPSLCRQCRLVLFGRADVAPHEGGAPGAAEASVATGAAAAGAGAAAAARDAKNGEGSKQQQPVDRDLCRWACWPGAAAAAAAGLLRLRSLCVAASCPLCHKLQPCRNL